MNIASEPYEKYSPSFAKKIFGTGLCTEIIREALIRRIGNWGKVHEFDLQK